MKKPTVLDPAVAAELAVIAERRRRPDAVPDRRRALRPARGRWARRAAPR